MAVNSKSFKESVVRDWPSRHATSFAKSLVLYGVGGAVSVTLTTLPVTSDLCTAMGREGSFLLKGGVPPLSVWACGAFLLPSGWREKSWRTSMAMLMGGLLFTIARPIAIRAGRWFCMQERERADFAFRTAAQIQMMVMPLGEATGSYLYQLFLDRVKDKKID